MTDRVALVTGAARGIGAATVAALVADGYRVFAVDSCSGDTPPPGVGYPLATRADLARVAAISEAVTTAVVDVRERMALDEAVASLIDRFGRLDAVVAAAGVIAGGRPLWETSSDELLSQWEVNALGVWNTAAATVPTMLASDDPGGCRFVAVASAAASHGLFHLSAYNASKHATVGIVRGLAADLVGTGVTAVAVSPGSTTTSMLHATANLYNLEDTTELIAAQLIRRPIAPEEIAATIVFCCSPAGAVLSGSVVAADGGFAR